MTAFLALGEVAEINPATSIQVELDDVCSFVPMEAVDETTAEISRIQLRPYRELSNGYSTFAENDVLLAKITPCMENGKCAIARHLRNAVGFGSTEFHVIRVSPHVLPEWIYYHWRMPQTRQVAERNMTGSAGQKRVPVGFLENLQLPVPTLVEQKRRVDRLRRVDLLSRTRRFALQLCDEIISAAFLEMFGDPRTNPKNYPRSSISELGRVETGNTPPRERQEYYGNDMEWIKSDNITLATMHPTKAVECLSSSGAQVGTVVGANSLLVTCIAGSVASIGNVVITDRTVAYNQQINGIIPHDDVDPYFLYALMVVAKPMVQRAATEAMKKMITKGRLEELVLFKPPLAEQRRFASIISHWSFAKQTSHEALRQAEHLFQSLLHQAFSYSPGAQ